MEYEYRVSHTTTEMTASQLNLLGKQGWELVSVTFLQQMFTYYFRKGMLKKQKTKENL